MMNFLKAMFLIGVVGVETAVKAEKYLDNAHEREAFEEREKRRAIDKEAFEQRENIRQAIAEKIQDDYKLGNLSLNCRKCKADAHPIKGSWNRYACEFCGNKFYSKPHKVPKKIACDL